MAGEQPMCVLLAEPDPLLVAVMAQALAPPRFALRHHVGDVDGLPAAVGTADVVVLGAHLPRRGLARVVPMLVSAGTRALVVSDAAFDEVSSTLLFAGATGFLSLTDSGLNDLAEAVLAIAHGSTALHPAVVHEVLQRWREQRSTAPSPPERVDLTHREAQTLAALSEGLSNRLIGKQLGVADKTVEAHKSRLFAKLGARNQAHAVRIATEMGLLGPKSTRVAGPV